MKDLKIWNGRGWGHRKYDKDGHFIPDPEGIKNCDYAYVCAKSRAHAVRIINEAVGYDAVSDSELKVYWSADCWGDHMKGVCDEEHPEIGVWTSQGYNYTPKRIYPITKENETSGMRKRNYDSAI